MMPAAQFPTGRYSVEIPKPDELLLEQLKTSQGRVSFKMFDYILKLKLKFLKDN